MIEQKLLLKNVELTAELRETDSVFKWLRHYQVFKKIFYQVLKKYFILNVFNNNTPE